MDDKTMKILRIAVGISFAAVLLSVISMIISGDWSQITLSCCMVAVLCSNIAIYAMEKNKNPGNKE